MAYDSTWFGQVFIRELEYIRRRRDPAAAAGATPPGAKETTVGIALSGGGIRSATTNLGILQALSRMGILPLADYLSTVSGGGYIGSCLTSLLSLPEDQSRRNKFPAALRSGDRPLFTTSWGRFPFNPDSTLGAAQIRHLRTHGSFLVTRKGLLKRETMRSVGNLLSGSAYHLVLVFLSLLAAALLYMSVLFFAAPSIDSSLRALTAPVATYATAYEGRLEGVTLPTRDPNVAGGPATVDGVAPTYLLSTAYAYPGLTEVLAAKWKALSDEIWTRGSRNWALPLLTALVGGLIAFASFVYLRQFGVPARRPKLDDLKPKAGESYEDAVAVHALRRTGLVSMAALAAWLVGVLFVANPGVLWLLLLVLAVASLRFTTWIIHICLPRLNGLWTRDTRSLWGAYQAMATYAMWPMVIVALFPIAVYGLREHSGFVGVSGIASLIVARFATFRRGPDAKQKPRSAAALRWLLGLAVGIGVLFVLIVMCTWFVPDRPPAAMTTVWVGCLAGALGAAAVLAFLGFVGDANRLSPHYFYRDRLAEAYLYTEDRRKQDPALKTLRDHIELPLKDLHYRDIDGQPAAAPTAPYHLISCAVNLAASRDLTRKDRKSGYFLFSRFFCGSTHTRYMDTRHYRGGDVKVARAITISGAAASSGIGGGTFFAQAFATVLFNLRLGYWMENPRGRYKDVPRSWQFWPWWLWQEMTMNTHEWGSMVNLSDGGHTGDNVGIYPLLQRQCALIIACDAEADPSIGFGSFTEALRHAYMDLHIDVDIDLTMVRPDPETGMSRSHCAVGLIRYPARNGGPRRVGYLVYLKNSLTGDEPEPVLNYKSTHPTFPHESTADQFFDDAQFESYRSLGNHIAEHAFAHWIHHKAFRAWLHADAPADRQTV